MNLQHTLLQGQINLNNKSVKTPTRKPQKTYSEWNLTLTAKCERENCKFTAQTNTILALVKVINDHNRRCKN